MDSIARTREFVRLGTYPCAPAVSHGDRGEGRAHYCLTLPRQRRVRHHAGAQCAGAQAATGAAAGRRVPARFTFVAEGRGAHCRRATFRPRRLGRYGGLGGVDACMGECSERRVAAACLAALAARPRPAQVQAKLTAEGALGRLGSSLTSATAATAWRGRPAAGRVAGTLTGM